MEHKHATHLARIVDLGLSTELHNETINLSRGDSEQDYVIVHAPSTAVSAIRPSFGHLPILLFTTRVTPRTAEALRRASVQYVDTTGNAWIKFGDVLIDVRGNLKRDTDTPTPSRSAINLFSTSRAKVTFTLLSWPELWEAPQREIAKFAQVSLGQVNNTLRLLAEAGFGPNDEQLIDLWAAAFQSGLALRLDLATYHGDPETLRPASTPIAISGEGAVTNLLRPATQTIYVQRLDPQLAIINRWRADGTPNIIVRRLFWRTPGGDHATVEPSIAPWPLVYADLLASKDPRVRGVAKEWKNSARSR